MAIKLNMLMNADSTLEHCRAMSSDEDSFCEAEEAKNKNGQDQDPLSFSKDLHSSGYSSVSSASPSSTCSSSSLMPCTFKTIPTASGTASANAQPGFRLLVPMQRPRGCSSKPVKRKNTAAHSGGEMEREDGEDEGEENSATLGFLSL